MNTTPCLLLEIKALCEILNLWEGRVGTMCTYLFFAYPFLSFLNCRNGDWVPIGLWWPYHWGIYVMVGFAMMGTSFTICHHFVTHMLPLFPFPLCFQGKYSEYWHWKKKEKRWSECAQEGVVEDCKKNSYIELEDVLNFPKHPATNHKDPKILIT